MTAQLHPVKVLVGREEQGEQEHGGFFGGGMAVQGGLKGREAGKAGVTHAGEERG